MLKKLKKSNRDTISQEQIYFFTKEWQNEERSAEQDIKEGYITKTKSLKELLKDLDK